VLTLANANTVRFEGRVTALYAGTRTLEFTRHKRNGLAGYKTPKLRFHKKNVANKHIYYLFRKKCVTVGYMKAAQQNHVASEQRSIT